MNEVDACGDKEPKKRPVNAWIGSGLDSLWSPVRNSL